MVRLGKVQKKSMKLKLCGNMDNIVKSGLAKSNNMISLQNSTKHKGKIKKRNRRRLARSKLAKGKNCKEAQLETGLNAKTNSQNEPLINKPTDNKDAVKILSSRPKGKKKNQITESLHKGFVVWSSHEKAALRGSELKLAADESDNSLSSFSIHSSESDTKSDLCADESNKSVSSFNIDSYPSDTESDLCAIESNKSVSSFNIDSYPADTESDLCAIESNKSVSSFNIDSYPADTESDLCAIESNKSVPSFNIDSYPADTESDLCAEDSNKCVSSSNIDSYPSVDEGKDETEKRFDTPLDTVPFAELEEKDRRTVFVGNIPKTVNWYELEKWFSAFGNIDYVKQHPVKENTFRRCAFIRYKDIEGATKALQEKCIRFDKYRLYIYPHKRPVEGYGSIRTVYVANLPSDTIKGTLINLFLKCGKIENVIIRDMKTGLRAGFVTFKCPSSVPHALKLDGEELEKRRMNVTVCLYNGPPCLSNKKNCKEEIGKKRNSGSFKNPRQQRYQINRGNRFKGQVSFKNYKVKKTQFQRDLKKRKPLIISKSFLENKRQVFFKEEKNECN